MKQFKTLFPLYLLALTTLFASCKKWLDVSPKTQIKENVQFSTRQGYTDALFGIYQNAAKPDGYGRNLTFGLLDILAQRYENKGIATSSIGATARFNYTEATVQATLYNVFLNSYSTIAQSNYILKNVDNSAGILNDETRSIIKGEALGMRGFLHFDLARLFSGRYNEVANGATPSIAYLKEFTVTPQMRLSLKEVIDACEADLKAAELLLSVNQNIDQIASNQGNTSADLFLQYRQNHMNYWAVKAALARLYVFKGDKVNALKYALEVINSQKFNFASQASLVVDATALASDLTFSSEHIFSVYVSNLKIVADDVFKNTAANGEATDLWSTRAKLNTIYQNGLVGYGTDIRNPGASKSLWNEVSSAIVYTKKFWSDNATNVKQRMIPVIRLPEMYYIAAESAATLPDAFGYLNVVRTNRLIPALPTNGTQATLDTELLQEYRKEFYGEGQLWHYYKRTNVVTLLDGVANPMTSAKYTFPLPNGELEFGLAGN